MTKYLIALAATIAAAAPAAAQDNKVRVDVSSVVNRLELDLAAVALPNNIVQVTPPVASMVCNMSTSQLASQHREGGSVMTCKAMMVSNSLIKAAKKQAVPLTPAAK